MSNNHLMRQLTHIHNKQPWIVLGADQKYSLSAAKNSSISHFYSFEGNTSNQETFAVPDGCVDILFDCNNSQPTAQVYGTPLEASNIKLISQHRYFGVRFASGVMPDFLNVSASELIDNSYNFLDLVPYVNQLFDGIVDNTDFSTQVALFNDFAHGKNARKHASATSQMLQSIYEHQGNIKIKEIGDLTGYTVRTLQRKFLDDMGMSAKTFSRIVRCQSAIYKINHNDNIIFSDLACDLGFTDQPHFLKEFKKLVSVTPLNYQNRIKDTSYLKKIEHI